MGVLLKDLANDLNLDIKKLNELIKIIKARVRKNPTNGIEIKESIDLIRLYAAIALINKDIRLDEILENFNKNLKKTKDYKKIDLESTYTFLKEAYSFNFEKKELELFNFLETFITNKKISIPIQNETLNNIQDKKQNEIIFQNIKKIKTQITNLKNINKLKNFEIELNNDIYVITGNNGIGKSTLLAALGQLVNKNSLSQEFQGNLYDNSQINFELIDSNNKSIKIFYKKYKESTKTKHWQSYLETGEEKNIGKLNGFIESGMEGERLNKFSKELKQKILEDIEKVNINNLLEEKDLTRYFNQITGKNYKFFSWKYSYKDKEKNKDITKEVLVYYIDERYLPEFTLSTGEYFLIQILHQLIKKINKNAPSLVILDEIELALNPKLQKKFVDFLKQNFCIQHQTTFILATQSISFIDNVNNVLLMRNNNGNVNLFNNFKGKIIKTYLGEDKTVYDKIIIVEDILAKIFIEQLINELSSQYLYIVFPFGGKDQIVKHFKEEKIINEFGKDIMIIYDGDVEEELINDIKNKLKNDLQDKEASSLRKIKKLFKNNKEKLDLIYEIEQKYIINNINTAFLPIQNVESYIVKLLQEENPNFVEKIQQMIKKNTTFFDIKDEINLKDYCNNKDKKEKVIFNNFINKLSYNSFNDSNIIRNKLIQIIIELNSENEKFNNLTNRIQEFLNK